MRRFFTGVLCIAIVLFCSCGEKKNGSAINDLKEDSVVEEKARSFFDILGNRGVSHLYSSCLPDLHPCVIIENQFNSILIYHSRDDNLLWVYVPLTMSRDDWDFRINGKDVVDSNLFQNRLYAVVRNGEIVTRKTSRQEIVDEETDSWPIGYGIVFDETDILKIESVANSFGATQKYSVSYTPNDGWMYYCDKPELYGNEAKADVFGFSKKNIVSQFKVAFKDKKECRLRFNRPNKHSNLMKFTLVKKIVHDMDFVESGGIEVGRDYIMGEGEKWTDPEVAKHKLRDLLHNLTQLKRAVDDPDLYRIDLYGDSDDGLVRILMGELERCGMNMFEIRILPRVTTEDK